VIPISDAESFETARRVSRQEGILIGGSGGLAVAAGLRVARDAGSDDVIVVLNPDSGRGYLSRVFNDEWMATFGSRSVPAVARAPKEDRSMRRTRTQVT
jgi:cystathionine beta-synthase